MSGNAWDLIGIPLVEARVDERGARVLRRAHLLGTPARWDGGRSVRVQLAIPGDGWIRYSLVPRADVEPLNEAARFLLDAQPPGTTS